MVTFIAPSYQEEQDPYVFVGALLAQTNPNWKAIIYNNGPNPRLRAFINEAEEPRLKYVASQKLMLEQLADPRISYVESEVNTGAWGCYNRANALQSMVDTEYVIQTSIQDYWLPNAVEEILKRNGADFIYWNSINHLAGYDRILETMPVINYIDWGNFAVKTALARKVGIQHPEAYVADGLFVQDCIKSGLIHKPVKIHQVLTIHN